MKIIHLSDPHIYTDKIHGIDPVSRFKKALDHILKNHNDADLFVITGDITDLGDKESYQLFIKIIQDANLPEQLDPKLIIGNHDNREEFKKNFPSIQEDELQFLFATILIHGTILPLKYLIYKFFVFKDSLNN